MSQIIAFVTQKGGTGKSSTAVHFAVWQSLQGRSIQVIDADAQQSTLTWLKSIDPSFPVISITNADDLIEQVPDLASQHDWLIIDGPGQVAEINRGILLVCDLAIVPCQPTALDVHSSEAVFRLVRQAQQVRKGLPNAVCFLSRAFTNTRLKTECENLLGQVPGVKYLPHPIHHRQILSDCFGQKASVWSVSDRELKKAAKVPIQEYQRLFTAIEEVC
jgi:chromosome partitioning protein